MIKYTLNLKNVTPLNRMQIEHLANLAGNFSSRIIFEHKNRVINGKSMLGLLSMGVTGEDDVTLVIEGDDEERAAREIKALLDSGVAPPKEASDAEALLMAIKRRYADILQENLLGIYLHGSLAAGCFQWERSDIDFLVVVRQTPSIEEKIALVEALYMLEKDAPPEGFEMSVLLAEACREPAFPMPYALHYSRRWTRDYERDPQGFCQRMHGEDPDLTTHILSLHAFGRAVYGPSVARMFGSVQREDVLCAIRNGLADAGEELHNKPVYYVLTLCRALAYLREGLVLDKKEAGQWGIAHASRSYQGVIQAALNAYEYGRDMFYDEAQAEDFCYDAMEELMK